MLDDREDRLRRLILSFRLQELVVLDLELLLKKPREGVIGHAERCEFVSARLAVQAMKERKVARDEGAQPDSQVGKDLGA